MLYVAHDHFQAERNSAVKSACRINLIPLSVSRKEFMAVGSSREIYKTCEVHRHSSLPPTGLISGRGGG